MSEKKLVVISDGYSQSYRSLIMSLKIMKQVDIVLVKNYKSKNTTETLKAPQEKLLEKIEGFAPNNTTSCLVDGIRRGISLLANDSGEILLLCKTIPLLHGDVEEHYDNLQMGNNLQQVGLFLKKSGIQVSFLSTLKGFSVLENWIDFVNTTQDYSSAVPGLVVKLSPFLSRLMMDNLARVPTSITPLNSVSSIAQNPVMTLPTNITDGMNLQTNNNTRNSNLMFLQGQMQAYQQHVSKNQLMLSNQEEGRSLNGLWSGILSWKGIDPNTNQTREISCNIMVLPIHQRDLSDYYLNLWPSKLVMASVLPLQTEYLQAHVKSSNLPLVRIVPIPAYPNSSQNSFSNLLNILSTRKVASIVRFSGDTGLLMVENAGKLIAFVCVKVGLSIVSKG